MSRLFALIGATIGGWLGWRLAEPAGLMTAYVASVVGTAVGVYLGRRAADRLA